MGHTLQWYHNTHQSSTASHSASPKQGHLDVGNTTHHYVHNMYNVNLSNTMHKYTTRDSRG